MSSNIPWRIALVASSLLGCTSLLGLDGYYVSNNSLVGVDGGASDAGSAADVTPADGGVDPACQIPPSESLESVREACAVFVAPSGADSNAGTREAPLKSLHAASAKAAAENKRVYVCNALYNEALAPTLPLEIFGGFVCPGGGDDAGAAWSYVPSSAARIVSPAAGEPALLVMHVQGTVHLEDVELFAAAGTDAHTSSIAVSVTDTSLLRLTRVRLVAGNGKDAVLSTLAPADPLPAPTDGVANSTVANVCVCNGGGTSTGGGVACPGGNGTPAYTPAVPTGNNGAGAGICGFGTAGSDAPNGADGDGGALGAIVGESFVPAAGAVGANGPPGQGGGGSCGGGGSGGCGGCGGGGGPAGAGGGASIGLLARAAGVELVDCKIETAAGGNGAAGKAGVAGAAGAQGGSFFSACFGAPVKGGNGGKGGSGGAGGGGAGGVSACVVYSSATPKLDDATKNGCKHGAGGAGGTSPGRAGSAGASEVVLQLP